MTKQEAWTAYLADLGTMTAAEEGRIAHAFKAGWAAFLGEGGTQLSRIEKQIEEIHEATVGKSGEHKLGHD